MKKIKYIVAILTLIIGFIACNKPLSEINTNPLALSALPDEYLFTTAIRQSFWDCSHDLRFFAQYDHILVTNNENRAADGYKDFHTQDMYRELFSAVYVGPLRYINEVLALTSAGKAKNPVRNAMAQIVAVTNFSRATDCWGDVPYSEGAQGGTIKYPKYDRQKAIYADMMEKLKSAITVLKVANPTEGYAGADPIYNNDLTKWVRFANSLRFRLAMRTRFADPSVSATIITECMGQPLIESNDQNFELKHQDSDNGDFYNHWFDLRKNQNYKMSDKFTEWLKYSNDPRLTVFIHPNSSGEMKGAINGLNDQAYSLVTWNDYSDPMPALYSKSLSQYMMSASEVWFLKAEAALFNLIQGDANQYYQQGTTLNFQQWNVDGTLISDFITNQPEGTLNGSTENKFRQIGTQMWIAFIPNFAEAWSNIRRTGYPEIPQRTDASVYSLGVTNGFLPKRFKYASNEYLNNQINVDAAVKIQGPDKIDTPVWWDVRGN